MHRYPCNPPANCSPSSAMPLQGLCRAGNDRCSCKPYKYIQHCDSIPSFLHFPNLTKVLPSAVLPMAGSYADVIFLPGIGNDRFGSVRVEINMH
jgi:hypothetical protein